MKKIKCSNDSCKKVFAHLLDNNTIDYVRQGHKLTATGSDYSVIGTCGWCRSLTSLIVKDGQLVTEGITFKEDKPNEPIEPPTPATSEPASDPAEDDSNGAASGATWQPSEEDEPEPAIDDAGAGVTVDDLKQRKYSIRR